MVHIVSLVVLLLESVIFGLFVIAIRQRNVAAAVNALGAFVLVLLPSIIEILVQTTLARTVVFGPELPLWLAIAGVLHSIGMLGLYESTWLWDHLTHTVTAALVAALIYAILLVTHLGIAGDERAMGTVWVLTVVFTLLIGVFWELIELLARDVGKRYDIEPVLVHYGWRDTGGDLGFDVVGTLLVVVVDLQVFVPVVEQFPGVAELLLLSSGSIVFVGSLLITVYILLVS